MAGDPGLAVRVHRFLAEYLREPSRGAAAEQVHLQDAVVADRGSYNFV